MGKAIKNYFLDWVKWPTELRDLVILKILQMLFGTMLGIFIAKAEGLYFTLTVIGIIALSHNILSIFAKAIYTNVNIKHMYTIMHVLTITLIVVLYGFVLLGSRDNDLIVGILIISALDILAGLILSQINKRTTDYACLKYDFKPGSFSSSIELPMVLAQMAATISVILITTNYTELFNGNFVEAIFGSSKIKDLTDADYIIAHVCGILLIIFCSYRIYYSRKYIDEIAKFLSTNKQSV